MKSIHKILLITDNHSPHGGGAEKVFFSLQQALQKYPELVVTTLSFASATKISSDSILLKETSSKLAQQCWRLFFNPLKYWQLRRILKKLNPDVIHLHNVKKYTVSLLKAVRGYRVIQTVHDFSSICPTGWNVHNDLQPCSSGLEVACRWQHKRDTNQLVYIAALYAFARMRCLLKKSVTHFIAPSPLLQHYLRHQQFEPCDYLPPLRETTLAMDFSVMRPQHFLYVGQLGKHKGVKTLITEFALACASNAELTLSIAGTGKEEIALRELVNNLQLQNKVTFLGWVNPAEQFASACALIFPSIGLESFGLVLTEAMQHSRAVIGANRGPTAWLVEDEKTGLLFDPLIAGDLAAKILLLAANPSLAAQYGRNGYEKSQTLMSNDEIVEHTVALYTSV